MIHSRKSLGHRVIARVGIAAARAGIAAALAALLLATAADARETEIGSLDGHFLTPKVMGKA